MAREAVIAALDTFGDPLMIHAPGRAARTLLENARGVVARGIGAQADEIAFTSGGTESVALAIWGVAHARRGVGPPGRDERDRASRGRGRLRTPVARRVRDRVRSACDEHGRVDLDRFAAAIRVPGTVLASLQHASHETGTMQQIGEAARLARAAGVRFHTDAAQTAGRLPIDVDALGVDLLSLSGHKFGGPPGVGALYIRRGVELTPYPSGDDRERKRRAGMENTPGVAGMAAALDALARRPSPTRPRARGRSRPRFATGSRRPSPGHASTGIRRTARPTWSASRSRGSTRRPSRWRWTIGASTSVSGTQASGRPEDPSPVLAQMGAGATPAFRVSVGPATTAEDVDTFVEMLPDVVEELQHVQEIAAASMARFQPPGTEVEP